MRLLLLPLIWTLNRLFETNVWVNRLLGCCTANFNRIEDFVFYFNSAEVFKMVKRNERIEMNWKVDILFKRSNWQIIFSQSSRFPKISTRKTNSKLNAKIEIDTSFSVRSVQWIKIKRTSCFWRVKISVICGIARHRCRGLNFIW